MSSSDGSLHILRIAFFSRILVLSLICLWRFLFEPYDTSASLNPPCLASVQSPPSNPVLWPRVGSAIERSIVWDGVYFVRIAECGYEYEQTYAFFPILPICTSLLSRSVFAPLVPVIGYRAVLGFSGYLLNNVAFLFAAVYFYRLSVRILKDSRAAVRASVLFCFNPASVFYSSLYSESLYALFSLGGLFHLFSGANTIAMLLLALSGSARSNGMLNAGYFCFQIMFQCYEAIFLKKQPNLAMQVIVVGALQSMCISAPFIAFQVYGYSNICLGRNSDNLRPWCSQRIPRIYDYLQSHYWGVGFLRYFQLRQLPNFLLASPILSLAVLSVTQYAILRPDIMFSLGFQASSEEKVLAARLYSKSADKKTDGTHTIENNVSSQFTRGDLLLRGRKHGRKEKAPDSFQDPELTSQETFSHGKGYSSILVLPFVYHLGFMTIMAFFVMHVQVATRFLSACPAIYWVASYVLVSPSTSYRRLGYFIWVHFVGYILLGSLLFSNFYPFT